MTKDDLRGVFAPITTPFKENGDVDYDGLKKNMEFYAASPLHGYLALGSNGENKNLTKDEQMKVLKVIMDGKAPQQKVMAGCIAETTRETIDISKNAEQLGVDFCTLLSPAYFAKQMTDPVLIGYFSEVADSIKTPCLLYCAPQFTGGVVLSVNLLKQLAKHPNIVGMKDSSTGNIDNYLLNAPDDFAVMAGSANFFISALAGGATGGVISLGNAFPSVTVELYDLFVQKKYDECFAMNKKILRLNKAVSGKGGVAAVKAAMDLAGLAGGYVRRPLLPIGQADIDTMKATLVAEGVL